MSESIVDMIELRTFSSIWYWVFLGTVWTVVIHAPLGVPADLLRRAETGSGAAQRDLETVVWFYARRRQALVDAAGALRIALWAFVLTVLGLLSVVYGVRLAQGLLLLVGPLLLVSVLTGRTAARLLADAPKGAALRAQIRKLRFWVQAIGYVAAFFTALWGMSRMVL